MNLHDEWCPCEECEGRPMVGLALMVVAGVLMLAALFRWVG